MRPGITRLEGQAVREPALQANEQRVIGAGANIRLVVNRTVGIESWKLSRRIRVILIQRAGAGSVEVRLRGTEIYPTAGEEANATRSQILQRQLKVRWQFVVESKAPGLHVKIASPMALQSAWLLQSPDGCATKVGDCLLILRQKGYSLTRRQVEKSSKTVAFQPSV